MSESSSPQKTSDQPVSAFPLWKAVAHLDAVLSRKDQAAFNSALRQLVEARGGFTEVANEAGLNRTALYRIVSESHDAKLSTVLALLSSLGLQLSVKRIGRYKKGRDTAKGGRVSGAAKQ